MCVYVYVCMYVYIYYIYIGFKVSVGCISILKCGKTKSLLCSWGPFYRHQLRIEYILWGIPTIESTFDVANMVKTATVKDVPINKCCASKHTGLLNSCLGKWHLLPYLVVPLISARVPQISTRVSAHCQAILFWHG